MTPDASGSSDADTDDTLSYHWEQTAGTAVTLSSATAAGPTFTAPSSAANLTFRVTVIDGQGGSDRDTVAIAVVANEAPTFTSSASFSLAEHTTSVGTVVATDPDAADSVTGYALSGTDASLFAITSAGVLSFSTAPDFESPKGGASDDSNSYKLTVTATGGAGGRALTANQNLSVSVTDANEPPSAPRNVRIRGGTGGTANWTTAKWSAPASDGGSEITGYDVRGRLRDERDGADVSTHVHNASVSASTFEEVLFTSIPGRTDYVYVRVRAKNAPGAGPWAEATLRV